MPYYISLIADDPTASAQIWKINTDTAERIDVSPSEGTVHKAEIGEDVLSTLHKRFPAFVFHKLELEPSEYYPRIVRPYNSEPTETLGYNPSDNEKDVLFARVRSTGQLHALIGQLQQICRVVHPEGDNLKAFGHEIRNFLIIAATEVEAQWKRILDANGSKGTNTPSYVKLSKPLKLPEFVVDFPYYPWLDPIAPFKDWGSGSGPTQELPWYAAYNNVKHDREKNFAQSSLLSAFQAISGCFVLLCAQHGWDFARRGDKALNEFLRLSAAPKWSPSQVYVPPLRPNNKWVPRNYKFDS
jgi:hypothetical protein